jgi:hypothetical protein
MNVMRDRPPARERRERTHGDGGGGWSPSVASSSRDAEDERWWLDHEVGILQRALEDRGEMGRKDLAEAVGGRYWGPGRFGRALREALKRRAIGQRARGRYGPS